jgi:predicted nucleic acid-binding protein
VPSTSAWADSGLLVALFARDDAHHDSAVKFVECARGIAFHSIWPVVTEASFLLGHEGKDALYRWLEQGPVRFHEITVADLPAIRATMKKYRSLAPDFTDAALVTLAAAKGIHAIATVDVRDFSAYRLPGGKAFERIWR